MILEDRSNSSMSDDNEDDEDFFVTPNRPQEIKAKTQTDQRFMETNSTNMNSNQKKKQSCNFDSQGFAMT